MKKNKMMRIAAFLLVAVLLSTCVISGTFAKFTSDFTGTGTAKVATWEIEVAEQTSEAFNFVLFDTINDDKGGAESNVKGEVMAPGTSGNFTIKVDNKSEVTAKCSIKSFKVLVDGEELASESPIKFTQPSEAEIKYGESKDMDFSWVWEFTDENENALAGKDIVVTIVLTVEQVD